MRPTEEELAEAAERSGGLRPLRVVQIGTEMGGGVAAVIDVVMNNVGAAQNVSQSKIVTHGNGSPIAKLSKFFSSIPALLGDLVTGKTDVYHVHFSTGASTFRKMLIVALIAAFGRSVVGHSHGGKYERFYGRQLGPLGRLAVRLFLRRFDRIIVLSPEWRRFFEGIGPDLPIAVVPNAVKVFEPNELQTSSELNILHLGMLGAAKGTYTLIEAFALLALRDPSIHLHLAGDGDLEEVQRRVSKVGLESRITVHGWVAGEKRDALLSRAGLFVLPSRAEGLPMSMLESMARGVPVIVTPVGGIPSVIFEGGNGLIVQPDDVGGLAAAIDRIRSDPELAQRLGAAGRKTVEDRFSAENFAVAIRSVYDGALAQRGHQRVIAAG